MKIKKRVFDIVFIIIITAVLVAVIEFDYTDLFMKLAFIPLLMSYQIGKYAERKFKD